MKNKETEEEARNRKLMNDLMWAEKRLIGVLRSQNYFMKLEKELTEEIREINRQMLA